MNIALDLDGTISHSPSVLGGLMAGMVKSGNRVIVLTGAIKGKEITRPERIAQLNSLGIHHGDHYDEIYIAVGEDMVEVARGKGRICREENVDLMIEDNEDFIRFIKAISPQTVTLQVKP